MGESIGHEAMFAAAMVASLGAIGAGIGIGRVGGSACKAISMTKDAQAKKDINASMLITAAMVEGVALFSVLIGAIMLFGGRNLL